MVYLLRRFYQKYLVRRHWITPRDIYQAQYWGEVCYRYDVHFRLWCALMEIAGNSIWHKRYLEVQKARKFVVKKDYIDNYKGLIDNMRSTGFDSRYPIVVDRNLNLIDGSHRLAVALALNIESIPVIVKDRTRFHYYGKTWFSLNMPRFLDKLDIEVDQDSILVDSLAGVVWNPALPYLEFIVTELERHYSRVEVQIHHLHSKDLKQLVKGIYKIDGVKPSNIAKKIELLCNSRDAISVASLSLGGVHSPYRIKSRTRTAISMKAERVKAIIRESLKKQIQNYSHDNILHLADNLKDSGEIAMYFSWKLDLTILMDSLKKFNYVLDKCSHLELDSILRPSFGSDRDFLVATNDFGGFCDEIESYINSDRQFLRVKLRVVDSYRRRQYRLEREGVLFFQFDITSINEITKNRSIIGSVWVK